MANLAQRLLLGILITLGFACGGPEPGTDSLGTVVGGPTPIVEALAASTQTPTSQVPSTGDETVPEMVFTGEFASDAVLLWSDLPPNFVEDAASRFGAGVGSSLYDGGYEIQSSFVFISTDEDIFFFFGFTLALDSTAERSGFDSDITKTENTVDETIIGLAEAGATNMRPVEGPDPVQVGNKAVTYKILADLDGNEVIFDSVTFRREGIAGFVGSGYQEDTELPLTTYGIASMFDERLLAVIKNDGKDTTGLLPPPTSKKAGIPLVNSEITGLYGGVMHSTNDLPQALQSSVSSQINQLKEAGQQVIECQYFPMDPVNQTGYGTHQFWYEGAPANIVDMLGLVPSGTHPFRTLGWSSVNECPEYAELAQEVRRRGWRKLYN